MSEDRLWISWFSIVSKLMEGLNGTSSTAGSVGLGIFFTSTTAGVFGSGSMSAAGAATGTGFGSGFSSDFSSGFNSGFSSGFVSDFSSSFGSGFGSGFCSLNGCALSEEARYEISHGDALLAQICLKDWWLCELIAFRYLRWRGYPRLCFLMCIFALVGSPGWMDYLGYSPCPPAQREHTSRYF